jgi:hypothetical protein
MACLNNILASSLYFHFHSPSTNFCILVSFKEMKVHSQVREIWGRGSQKTQRNWKHEYGSLMCRLSTKSSGFGWLGSGLWESQYHWRVSSEVGPLDESSGNQPSIGIRQQLSYVFGSQLQHDNSPSRSSHSSLATRSGSSRSSMRHGVSIIPRQIICFSSMMS